VNPSVFSSIGDNCDWAIFNPATPGNYTFEYEVLNDFGCVFTDDITIEVVARPNFTLAVDDFCIGVSDLVATATPFNTDYTYTWSSSDGAISGVGASVDLINISDTTSVSVIVDWPDYDNCDSEQSAIVNYIPLIQPTASFDSCQAVFPLMISAADQVNPGVIYTWSKDGTLMSNETEAVLEVTEQATYTLTVSEPTCPYSQTTTFRIAPPLIITDSQFDICIEELPFVYNPETQNQDVIWSWSYYPYEVTEENDTLLDFLVDDISAPSFALVNEGEYQIVIEQTQDGCSNSDVVNIEFLTEYCTLLIPNVMTPNGDGDNDTFKVQSIARYPGSTCQIFNRWGNLVFETKSYDGSWNAADLPDGVYFYVIGVKRSSGVEYHSGDLTIIR
jgi:gliding motility-associated-like protein